jgi:hypothetical protein
MGKNHAIIYALKVAEPARGRDKTEGHKGGVALCAKGRWCVPAWWQALKSGRPPHTQARPYMRLQRQGVGLDLSVWPRPFLSAHTSDEHLLQHKALLHRLVWSTIGTFM